MSIDPAGDPTTAEQGVRDVGQAIHQHTQQEVLEFLPQLTSFVMPEFRAVVLRALYDMPPDLVEPLLLRVRDQRSIEEVARLEGIDPREVDRRVEEAGRMLSERVRAEYDDLGEIPAVEALLAAVEQ